MGAAKITFDNNWLNDGGKKNLRSRKVHKFEQMRVTRSEDLPELMSTRQVAAFLKKHYKTIEEYRLDGSIKFMKIRGRYFSTPEYIAEFLEREVRK